MQKIRILFRGKKSALKKGVEIDYKMVVCEIINDQASCPHCDVLVNGFDQVQQIFGLRNMGDGTIRVQSWCKKCRNESSKGVIA